MIRKAEPRDKNGIFDILSKTDTPWSMEGIAGCIENNSCICLVYETDVIQGVVFLQAAAGECEILNFAVKEDCRRHGIGCRLLCEGLKICSKRGAVSAYLEVRSLNEGAIALYKKMGFKIVGIRKEYYSAPLEDALIMKGSCDKMHRPHKA